MLIKYSFKVKHKYINHCYDVDYECFMLKTWYAHKYRELKSYIKMFKGQEQEKYINFINKLFRDVSYWYQKPSSLQPIPATSIIFGDINYTRAEIDRQMPEYSNQCPFFYLIKRSTIKKILNKFDKKHD